MNTKYLLAVLFCITGFCALAQTQKDSTKIKKPHPVHPGGFDSKVVPILHRTDDKTKVRAKKTVVKKKNTTPPI